MPSWRRLIPAWIISTAFGKPLRQNETRTISNELFHSLEELSRLVDISYCVGTSGVQQPFKCLSHCDEFPNLELVTTWSTGMLLSDSCGYVALSHDPGPKRIIVAFRGTYSITNTIIDLSAVPQAYVPYPGNGGNESESESGKEQRQPEKCDNCTVHAGFMSSWRNTRDTILPVISDALEKNPDYEVTLVGHSLGGAVAALAALEMQMMGWNPQVTTFGEPMVGNVGFAKYLDNQFKLGNHNDRDLEEQRFRRVTHVDDPIPLLPLSEWGYAPHAGEIFISRPELPPVREDIHLCIGNQDPGCISGSESPESLHEIHQHISIPLDVLGTEPVNPCPVELDVKSSAELDGQVVLGKQRRTGQTKLPKCASPDNTETAPLYPRSWDWNLIPARYRLWELFFAHRDYFWRIGLCFPGGDPTG